MKKRTPHNKVKFTEEEVNFIKSSYNKLSNREIASRLNKSKKTVIRILKELNLSRTKEEKSFLLSNGNKKRGRDLSFDFVSKIAKQYNTRHEFYLKDHSAYNAAIKNNWIDKICEHMVDKNFSIPQLILKNILEFILKEKCIYNDRCVIKPLEIDCYFPKWKLGFEYDGKFYHNKENDEIKKEICKNQNIKLFNITEETEEYRKYEKNIKNQLISFLPQINEITGLHITSEVVQNYNPEIIFPRVFTDDEIDILKNIDIKELRNNYKELYNRAKKYYDISTIKNYKKYKTFKNFEEYKDYLISKNYKSYTELVSKEHAHRIAKRFNVSMDEIKSIFKKG